MLVRELPFHKHEISTHPAGFRTFHHQSDVPDLGVLSTLRETVWDARETFLVAGDAITDTLIHIDT